MKYITSLLILALVSAATALNQSQVHATTPEQKQNGGHATTTGKLSDQTTNHFGIYLMAKPIDRKLAVYGKGEGEWESVPLLDAPVISAQDIERYDWDSHEIHLRSSLEGRLPRIPVEGLGFVVVANGERIYPGVFTTSISSFSFALPAVDVPLAATVRTVSIARGYPSDSFGKGKDPRSDPRIRKALEALGKLNPKSASQPRGPTREMAHAPYSSITITTNDTVLAVEPGVGSASLQFLNLDGDVVRYRSVFRPVAGTVTEHTAALRKSTQGGWQTPVIIHAGPISLEWSEGDGRQAYLYFDPRRQKVTIEHSW